METFTYGSASAWGCDSPGRLTLLADRCAGAAPAPPLLVDKESSTLDDRDPQLLGLVF
jgi:hypothetical protein